MKLAVVILNWNNAEQSIAAIHHVSGWHTLQPDIWVVDNASRDGDADRIAEQCQGVRLIRSPRNLGFGGGNNLAIDRARHEGAEAILLLNNDAFIEERAVEDLLAVFSDRSTVGIVGPLIRETVADQTYYTLGGRDIVEGYDTHIVSDTPPDAGTPLITVDYVPGTAALIRAAMLEQVALFDEEYFFSGEMADLCKRARAMGWETFIVPSALANHRDGAGAQRHSLYAYYSVRNRFLFARKHGSRWHLLLWSARCLRIVLRHLRKRQAAIARCYWLALIDGLVGRYGNQHERVQPS